MHRRSVQPVPEPKGRIIAEAPKPEERTGTSDHPTVTLKRSIANSYVLAWSMSQRPSAQATRAAEVLAETQSGDKVNLKLVETKEKDGTERLTVASDDGQVIGGTDWTFPESQAPRTGIGPLGVLALGKTDFSARPKLGAGIVYHRGPVMAFVGGFKKELIGGVGIRF